MVTISQIGIFLQANGKTSAIYGLSCLIIYMAAKQDFLKQNAIARQEFAFLASFSPQYWSNSSDVVRSSRVYAIGITILFVLIASTGNLALFKIDPTESSSTPALAVALSMLLLISNPVNPYKMIQDSWRKTMYDYALIPGKIDELQRDLSTRQFDYNTISQQARRALFPLFSVSGLTGIDSNATPAIWKRVRLTTLLYILKNAKKTLNSHALSLATFGEKLDLISDNLRTIISDAGEGKILHGLQSQRFNENDLISSDSAYELRLSKHDDKLTESLLHAELLLACAIATREIPLTDEKAFVAIGFYDMPILDRMPTTQSSWVAVSFVLSFILIFPLLAIGLRYAYLLPSPSPVLAWPHQDDFSNNLFSSVHYTYIPVAAALYFGLRGRPDTGLNVQQWIMPTIAWSAIAAYLSIIVVKSIQILVTQQVVLGSDTTCPPVSEGGTYQLHCILLGGLPSQLLTVALSALCAVVVTASLNEPLAAGKKSTYRNTSRNHIKFISIIIVLSLFHFLSKMVIDRMIPADRGFAIVTSVFFCTFLLSFYFWMASNALHFQQHRATISSGPHAAVA